MSTLRSIPALAWIAASTLCLGIGEYLSKRWGMRPAIGITIWVVTAYAVGTLLWLPAMLHGNTLARWGTIWNLFAVVMTVAIGVGVFHEHLNLKQWLGFALAAVAVWMLS